MPFSGPYRPDLGGHRPDRAGAHPGRPPQLLRAASASARRPGAGSTTSRSWPSSAPRPTASWPAPTAAPTWVVSWATSWPRSWSCSCSPTASSWPWPLGAAGWRPGHRAAAPSSGAPAADKDQLVRRRRHCPDARLRRPSRRGAPALAPGYHRAQPHGPARGSSGGGPSACPGGDREEDRRGPRQPGLALREDPPQHRLAGARPTRRPHRRGRPRQGEGRRAPPCADASATTSSCSSSP